jgi:histone H3/H4
MAGSNGGGSARDTWYLVRSEREKLLLARDKRQMVDIDVVMRIMCAVAAAVKQSILGVPAAVAPRVAPHAVAEAEARIYRALYEALDGLSEDKLARIIEQACAGVTPAKRKGAKR